MISFLKKYRIILSLVTLISATIVLIFLFIYFDIPFGYPWSAGLSVWIYASVILLLEYLISNYLENTGINIYEFHKVYFYTEFQDKTTLIQYKEILSNSGFELYKEYLDE